MSGWNGDGRQRLVVAVLLGLLAAFMVPATAGLAKADEAARSARMQDVQVDRGEVRFLLSVAGLAAGEEPDPQTLTVSVDGQEVEATGVPAAGTGAGLDRSVMLMLDTSGSMAQDGRLQTAKAAAAAYLDSVPADVAVGLVAFAEDARVVVRPTTDRAAVRKAVDAVRADGATALYDAVVLTADALGDQGARSAVLLSDGQDEGSRATGAQAAAALRDSGVVVDAVSLTPGATVQQLSALAGASGGTVVAAGQADAVAEAFDAAARSAATSLAVTAPLPAGTSEGTSTLSATVTAGGAPVSDQAVVVITPESLAVPEAGPVAVEVAPAGVFGQVWFLPLLLVLLFGAFAVIAVLAVRAGGDREQSAGGRSLRRRLDPYRVHGGSGPVVTATSGGKPQMSSPIALQAVALAERVVNERDVDQRLEGKLDSAAVPMKPAEWAVLHVSVAIVAAAVAGLLTGFAPLWMLVGLGLGLAVPFVVLDARASARQKKFYQALPDALQLLSGSVASGYSFPQGVATVAAQAKGPMAEELNRAVVEARLGVPMEDALDDVAARMRSKDFSWVVMAVRINRQVGGNLAEVLRTVAATLRERERLRRQVLTLSSEGRLSAIVLGILPFFVAGAMALLNPGYLSLLVSQPIGWAMLAGAAGFYIVGVLWMRKLVRMDV